MTHRASLSNSSNDDNSNGYDNDDEDDDGDEDGNDDGDGDGYDNGDDDEFLSKMTNELIEHLSQTAAGRHHPPVYIHRAHPTFHRIRIYTHMYTNISNLQSIYTTARGPP